jgi:hypothetical protein
MGTQNGSDSKVAILFEMVVLFCVAELSIKMCIINIDTIILSQTQRMKAFRIDQCRKIKK